jgi:hypothetical protein
MRSVRVHLTKPTGFGAFGHGLGHSLDSDFMRAESAALIPRCAECEARWLPADEERWQAHWVDDGPEEKLIFYCPECAEREFGGGG